MKRQTTKPDPILVKDQLDAVQALIRVFGMAHFVQSMIWILAKQEQALYGPGTQKTRLIPLVFNSIQRHLDGNLARMNRVLKARQAGLTTYFLLARLFSAVVTSGGKTGLLISQNSLYAGMHFAMVRRAYRYFGALDPRDPEANALSESFKANLLHTSFSNRRELVFDQLDSRLMIESAEVEEAGQGITLHHVVASEVARWSGNPEATISNIKGALVGDGTFDEESTANGLQGYFCEQFLNAWNNPDKADAKSHYYSWWASEEYCDYDLAPREQEELVKDMTADEKRVIAIMHKELSDVAWTRKKAA